MLGIWRTKIGAALAHPGIKKYLGSTTWLLANKILSLFASLFIGIWVAKYLGPKHYGEFNYVQSFVGLFSIVASLGLDSLIVRELINKTANRDEILGSAFTLKIIGSLFLFLILGSIQIGTNIGSANSTYVFLLVLATSFNSFKIIEYYFISKVKGDLIAKANIIVLTISSILKITFILCEVKLINFFLLLTLDSLFVAIAYVYFYVKNVGKLGAWKFKKSIAIQLMKDGWPLILSGFVTMIYMKVKSLWMMNQLVTMQLQLDLVNYGILFLQL
jgi:O-antigen/teichoic acid export membrane protein